MNAADALMAIFGLHRGNTMKIKDVQKDHWVRLASGELLRYFCLDRGYARCQQLGGRIVTIDPETQVEVVKPLGYSED